MEGDRPDILWILARINVLKNRPKAARIFLNVLSQIPFQGTRAKAMLAQIESDPLLNGDPATARIRCRMATNDLPHAGLPLDALLESLLKADPQNRMAFEYLMAHYLLTLDLEKAVDRLSELDSLGYQGIPRDYEQALLLWERRQRVEISLKGQRVRAETLDRFRRFTEALKERLYETAQGRAFLEKEFGDTYWFYYYTSGNRAGSNPSNGGKTS